jgi:ubiquinone/menaquinone biosynthesis C-methylase UbiE
MGVFTMSDQPSTLAEHKARVQAQFGRSAQDYVSSPGHRTGQDLVRLVELAQPSPSDTALDVATGGGHTALALAPHVGSVVASDLTPQMLEAAREFILGEGVRNATFEIADAEHMPFADESFDIVTCRIAPHHFAAPERFVSEVGRVLRANGRFVLMDSISPEDAALDAFINELEARRDPTHVRSYSLSEWSGFIEAAGLVLETHEDVIRYHEWEPWTARSKMTPEDRAALDAWVLAQPNAALEFFEVDIQDGEIQSFMDLKVLLRARKR